MPPAEETLATPPAPAPAPEALDVDAILDEYRRREMLAHLTGPIISIVVHAVLLTLAFCFMTTTPKQDTSAVEVEVKELEVKELDPKVMQELQKLEQMADEVVPTVERPVVEREAALEMEASTDITDAMAGRDGEADLSGVLDVKVSDTPLKLSTVYSNRVTVESKTKARERYGGTVVTETGVTKALRWLKDHQEPNGAWSKSQPDAMTGLGLLTFLAHGETPTSEEFGPSVQKAMQYLTNRMMAVPDNTPAD